MPPLKAGLLKRKRNPENAVKATEKSSSESESNDVEDNLMQSVLENDDDSADSEGDNEGPASDGEVEEVMFDSDADSNFGDEEESHDGSQGSSDLSDSEAEDESDEDSDEARDASDTEDSDDAGEESTSADSGTESSPPSTQLTDETNEDSLKQKKQVKSETKKQVQNEKNKKQVKNVTKKKVKSDTKKEAQPQKSKSSVDVLADKIKDTRVTTLPVVQRDEYSSGDTSDEEDVVNTCGAVPAWWYREYPHVGYDVAGRRLLRPPRRDHIDDFLKRCEDPEFWRTVQDPATGQDVVLSKEDLQLLARIREQRTPTATDTYEPWVEWFSSSVLATPLRGFPEHKRSFLPSRADQQQIGRIVHALKMGWTKTRKQLAEERKKKRERQFYDLWGAADKDGDSVRAGPRHIPAPRRPPPAHAESYNPPPEYLLDALEMKEWNKLAETPWKRKYTFLPTKYSSLRAVPAFPRYCRERFLRCLDLYLAPRAIKMRLTISASDLVPQLPSPRDLQPFPTSEALCLRGHSARVRDAGFDPSGQYIVSASDDHTVKVWETATGRCLRTLQFDAPVAKVLWCPRAALTLLCVLSGNYVYFVNPGRDIGNHEAAERTDELLEEPPPQHDTVMDARTAACVRWEAVSAEQWARGVRGAVWQHAPGAHAAWHARGDYVAVTLAAPGARAVVVHQLSARRSQLPLASLAGRAYSAEFLPGRPQLAVATQRSVRIYDLAKQRLVRKLTPGAQWVSGVFPHPRADHLLVTSYDRKCMWFDLELSASPYQTLRVHGGAVRAAAFHARYPLFATAGDDPHIVVSHGMVYNDLLQNPLIVPLKQLRGGDKTDDLCVLSLAFHPTQPWLLAANADHTLRLYT